MYAMAFILTIVLVAAIWYAVTLTVSSMKEKFEGSDMNIVLIYSQKCPYCHKFLPTFEKVSKKFPGIPFNSYEVSDPASKPFVQYARGYPTTVAMKGDIKVDEFVGNGSEEDFASFVQKAIA